MCNYFSGKTEAFWTIGLTCCRFFELARNLLEDIIEFPLPSDSNDQSNARLEELLKVKDAEVVELNPQRSFMFSKSVFFNI